MFCLTGCAKRNFFPDEDDPGSSRFTSHGYNIATNYINGMPYINPFSKYFGSSLLSVQKAVTKSTFDTLSPFWQIQRNDSTLIYNPTYQSVTLLMPVPKSFTQTDFLALNGQRFSSNTNSINLQSYADRLSGSSNVYFVQIKADTLNNSKNYIISGLFPEFDTFITLRPLKPSISGGRSLNLEKVVGRKPFGNMAGSYYFWGLWHFYVRR